MESIANVTLKENMIQNENVCFDKNITLGGMVVKFYVNILFSKYRCYTDFNVGHCGKDNFFNCSKTIRFRLCFKDISELHIIYYNKTLIDVYEACLTPPVKTLNITSITKTANLISTPDNAFHSTNTNVNAYINSTTYQNVRDINETQNCTTPFYATSGSLSSLVSADSTFKISLTIVSCFLSVILMFLISHYIFSNYRKHFQNLSEDEVYSTVGNSCQDREIHNLIPCYESDEPHYSCVTEDMLFHPSASQTQKLFDGITSNTLFDADYVLIEDDRTVEPNVYSKLGVPVCPKRQTYDHLIGVEHISKDYISPCENTVATTSNEDTLNCSSESDIGALILNTSMIDVKSLYATAQSMSETST